MSMSNIELITLPITKDERGWIISPPEIEEFEHSSYHIPSLKPKAIRGNHYHPTHTEAIIILGGKCLVASRDIESDHYEEFIYEGIIKQMLIIRPKITHAFKNIHYRSLYLVCFTYGSKDVAISSEPDLILR